MGISAQLEDILKRSFDQEKREGESMRKRMRRIAHARANAHKLGGGAPSSWAARQAAKRYSHRPGRAGRRGEGRSHGYQTRK